MAKAHHFLLQTKLMSAEALLSFPEINVVFLKISRITQGKVLKKQCIYRKYHTIQYSTINFNTYSYFLSIKNLFKTTKQFTLSKSYITIYLHTFHLK